MPSSASSKPYVWYVFVWPASGFTQSSPLGVRPADVPSTGRQPGQCEGETPRRSGAPRDLVLLYSGSPAGSFVLLKYWSTLKALASRRALATSARLFAAAISDRSMMSPNLSCFFVWPSFAIVARYPFQAFWSNEPQRPPFRFRSEEPLAS